MTRTEFLDSIHIGHNLGNGLECREPVRARPYKVTVDREITDINGYHDFRIVIQFPDGTYDYFYSYEELWSNIPVSQQWFDTLKSHGVQAVRVPINLSGHIIDNKNHTVDPTWLKRIREVVEMCITSGMICILTLHTDFVIMYRSGSYRSIIDTERDPSKDGVGRLMSVWKQMAEYVNDISADDLAFELTNEFRLLDIDSGGEGYEPSATSNEEKGTYAARLNKYLFDTIRGVGGNAAERFLLIGAYCNDPGIGIEPVINSIINDMDDKCLLTACYYAPWQFTVCNQHTIWEYAGEVKDAMDSYLNTLIEVRDKYNIPIVVTEYGVGANEHDMKGKDGLCICNYIYTVMKLLSDNNFPAFVWDPGYILRRDEFNYGIPFWPEMLKGAYFNEEFNVLEIYDDYVNEINFDRLVCRTGKTLEEIQALDILPETEEV